MTPLTKRSLIAGAGALVVAGVAAVAYESGTAGAQAAPTPTPKGRDARASFLQSLATKLGIPLDKLQAAIAEVRKDHGPANRPGGPWGGFGPMGGRGGMVGGPATLEEVAKALGITVDQLRQEWPGKSIADLAKAHGVDVAKVKASLVAALGARVDAAVTAGKLTAERAKAAKDAFAAHVDAAISRAMPAPGPGRMGRGGPWGFGPFGRGGKAAPTPTAPKKGASDDAATPNA